jgi:hypothetical protein
MAWSIFTQGGGTGAAAGWAEDFLAEAGLPVSPANEQFVYDWEESEGGGGAWNPLNQGDVAGSPQLTSTGSQYGGGAADYVSEAAGLEGAVDYLNYPDYSGVKAALETSSYSGAEQALWASPWAASHYGYGTRWNTAAFPGDATSSAGTAATLDNAGSTVGGIAGAALGPGGVIAGTVLGGAANGAVTTGETDIVKAGAELIALLVGAGLVAAGVYKLASPASSIASTVDKAKTAGELAPLAAA